MTEMAKLRALLSHWVDHNREHALESERWAGTAEQARHQVAAGWIRHAIEHVQQTNDELTEALDALGGPVFLETHDHAH